MKCFSCQNVYNCKYYANELWSYWMLLNPEEGCPANKYSFESLIYAYLGGSINSPKIKKEENFYSSFNKKTKKGA